MKRLVIPFSILLMLASGCGLLEREEIKMFLGGNTSDEQTEALNINPSDGVSENTWAKAYLGVVNDLVDRYGEGAIAPNSSDGGDYMIGVGVVRLIDFDGDGTHELYCAYQDGDGYVNKQAIYGYENGLVILLKECRVSNPGTGVSPSVTFLTKDGRIYLVDMYEIANGNYYTLQKGEMVPVLSYYIAWGEGRSTINGTAASYGDIAVAIEEMETGGTMERISFAYDIDYAEITKTQEVITEISIQAQQAIT